MRITNDDVVFWQAKQPRPKWWFEYKRRIKVSKPIPEYSIDRVVNGHAEVSDPPRHEAHEILEILKKSRARGDDLLPVLEGLISTYSRFGSVPEKRRHSYCLKWWHRLFVESHLRRS